MCDRRKKHMPLVKEGPKALGFNDDVKFQFKRR